MNLNSITLSTTFLVFYIWASKTCQWTTKKNNLDEHIYLLNLKQKVVSKSSYYVFLVTDNLSFSTYSRLKFVEILKLQKSIIWNKPGGNGLIALQLIIFIINIRLVDKNKYNNINLMFVSYFIY